LKKHSTESSIGNFSGLSKKKRMKINNFISSDELISLVKHFHQWKYLISNIKFWINVSSVTNSFWKMIIKKLLWIYCQIRFVQYFLQVRFINKNKIIKLKFYIFLVYCKYNHSRSWCSCI
jgi:hypothetical protein